VLEDQDVARISLKFSF